MKYDASDSAMRTENEYAVPYTVASSSGSYDSSEQSDGAKGPPEGYWCTSELLYKGKMTLGIYQ